MYLDKFTKLSDAQAVSATGFGTNVIDLTTARSIGSGKPMSMFFSVTTTADTTTGDEDYQFVAMYAANADQSTGNEELLGSRVFESTPSGIAQDAALLVEGFVFSIPLPAVTSSEVERYLGVQYVLAGTTPTISIDCWVAPTSMGDEFATYANGYDIN